MTYVIAYVAVLIVFGTIDAVWLTTMGAILYRPALGDILAQSLRVLPAIAFYLLFPIGIVVFAVLPGLRAQSPVTAQLQSGVLGVIKQCDGSWCRLAGDGFDGWIEQNRLWGVYPDEKIE